MFNLVAKQPWKKLKLDEFDDLIECQVLTDYTIDKTVKAIITFCIANFWS